MVLIPRFKPPGASREQGAPVKKSDSKSSGEKLATRIKKAASSAPPARAAEDPKEEKAAATAGGSDATAATSISKAEKKRRKKERKETEQNGDGERRGAGGGAEQAAEQAAAPASAEKQGAKPKKQWRVNSRFAASYRTAADASGGPHSSVAETAAEPAETAATAKLADEHHTSPPGAESIDRSAADEAVPSPAPAVDAASWLASITGAPAAGRTDGGASPGEVTTQTRSAATAGAAEPGAAAHGTVKPLQGPGSTATLDYKAVLRSWPRIAGAKSSGSKKAASSTSTSSVPAVPKWRPQAPFWRTEGVKELWDRFLPGQAARNRDLTSKWKNARRQKKVRK